jgi:DNA-directed RNA polymerase beta' subunit
MHNKNVLLLNKKLSDRLAVTLEKKLKAEKFKSIKVCLASPESIKQWANPFDEYSLTCKDSRITNPKTFNYKTLKPDKGGLFCEDVFGDLGSQSRRYKLGYIELMSPVTHIWYLKGATSYISILLNLKRKHLEKITYCSELISSHVKSFKHDLNMQNIDGLIKNNNFKFHFNQNQTHVFSKKKGLKRITYTTKNLRNLFEQHYFHFDYLKKFSYFSAFFSSVAPEYRQQIDAIKIKAFKKSRFLMIDSCWAKFILYKQPMKLAYTAALSSVGPVLDHDLNIHNEININNSYDSREDFFDSNTIIKNNEIYDNIYFDFFFKSIYSTILCLRSKQDLSNKCFLSNQHNRLNGFVIPLTHRQSFNAFFSFSLFIILNSHDLYKSDNLISNKPCFILPSVISSIRFLKATGFFDLVCFPLCNKSLLQRFNQIIHRRLVLPFFISSEQKPWHNQKQIDVQRHRLHLYLFQNVLKKHRKQNSDWIQHQSFSMDSLNSISSYSGLNVDVLNKPCFFKTPRQTEGFYFIIHRQSFENKSLFFINDLILINRVNTFASIDLLTSKHMSEQIVASGLSQMVKPSTLFDQMLQSFPLQLPSVSKIEFSKKLSKPLFQFYSQNLFFTQTFFTAKQSSNHLNLNFIFRHWKNPILKQKNKTVFVFSLNPFNHVCSLKFNKLTNEKSHHIKQTRPFYQYNQWFDLFNLQQKTLNYPKLQKKYTVFVTRIQRQMDKINSIQKMSTSQKLIPIQYKLQKVLKGKKKVESVYLSLQLFKQFNSVCFKKQNEKNNVNVNLFRKPFCFAPFATAGFAYAAIKLRAHGANRDTDAWEKQSMKKGKASFYFKTTINRFLYKRFDFSLFGPDKTIFFYHLMENRLKQIVENEKHCCFELKQSQLIVTKVQQLITVKTPCLCKTKQNAFGWLPNAVFSMPLGLNTYLKLNRMDKFIDKKTLSKTSCYGFKNHGQISSKPYKKQLKTKINYEGIGVKGFLNLSFLNNINDQPVATHRLFKKSRLCECKNKVDQSLIPFSPIDGGSYFQYYKISHFTSIQLVLNQKLIQKKKIAFLNEIHKLQIKQAQLMFFTSGSGLLNRKQKRVGFFNYTKKSMKTRRLKKRKVRTNPLGHKKFRFYLGLKLLLTIKKQLLISKMKQSKPLFDFFSFPNNNLFYQPTGYNLKNHEYSSLVSNKKVIHRNLNPLCCFFYKNKKMGFQNGVKHEQKQIIYCFLKFSNISVLKQKQQTDQHCYFARCNKQPSQHSLWSLDYQKYYLPFLDGFAVNRISQLSHHKGLINICLSCVQTFQNPLVLSGLKKGVDGLNGLLKKTINQSTVFLDFVNQHLNLNPLLKKPAVRFNIPTAENRSHVSFKDLTYTQINFIQYFFSINCVSLLYSKHLPLTTELVFHKTFFNKPTLIFLDTRFEVDINLTDSKAMEATARSTFRHKQNAWILKYYLMWIQYQKQNHRSTTHRFWLTYCLNKTFAFEIKTEKNINAFDSLYSGSRSKQKWVVTINGFYRSKKQIKQSFLNVEIAETLCLLRKNIAYDIKQKTDLVDPSRMLSPYFKPKQTLLVDQFETKHFGRFDVDMSEFIANLIFYLVKKQPYLVNRYYTICQSFSWLQHIDLQAFVAYMSSTAHATDKVIPVYFERAICFDVSLTGANVIKMFLKNISVRQNINETFSLSLFDPLFLKSIMQKQAFTNKQQILVSKIHPNIKQSLMQWVNANKKRSIMQLVMMHIKEKIKRLDTHIKDYETFLMFRLYPIRQAKKRGLKTGTMQQYGLTKIFRKVDRLRSVRRYAFRRLKLIQPFLTQNPEWMVLDVLPVLPPDLRPILVLDSQQVAVSDLNKLYQKVIFRNQRLRRLRYQHSSAFINLFVSSEMRYAHRLLQEAVDALIENGKADTTPMLSSNNRPLKSLSDMLKGKKGRFRQNLLGKRVDYSGRSVIVVGPELRLYECGLPKEIAIELFQPFLIRQLIVKKFAHNFINAKKIIKAKPPKVWKLLEEIMHNRPILLNRAPTLHRLGIQAFKPKLINGRAILLHPLVCTAFNADFDGDQMAVHIPLSAQACSEAWKLMWSRNNILSPATGEPIITPSQDMVLGCYYLTTGDPLRDKKHSPHLKKIQKPMAFFHHVDEVVQISHQQTFHFHDQIWLKWDFYFEFGFKNQQCIEIQLDSNGNMTKVYSDFLLYSNYQSKTTHVYLKTTLGRVLMNQCIFDCLCLNNT